MGFWGTDLYSNDTACDIKETYLDFIKSEKTNKTAYIKTLSSC